MVATAHRSPEPGLGLIEHASCLQHEPEVVHRGAVAGGDSTAIPPLGRGGLPSFLQQDREVIHRLGVTYLGRPAGTRFDFDRIATIFQ